MVGRLRKKTTPAGKILKWAILGLLVVVIVGFRLVGEIGLDFAEGDRFFIVRVVDGDTVHLSGGDRLRLANIDTPELDEPFYEEATRFLADLVEGKECRVEFSEPKRDKYGRLLGYLHVDTMVAGEEILRRGLGYILLFSEADYYKPMVRRLLAAQRRAMSDKVGLWSLEREPEEHYVALSGSLRFHRPHCASVSDLKPGRYRIFETREEALYEGLAPCRRCRP